MKQPLTVMKLEKALREAVQTGCSRRIADAVGRHGSGGMVFRATPRGGGFYYRYTRPDGARDELKIGQYDSRGKAGMTLKQAREKFLEWSALHRAGKRDVRTHLRAGAEKQPSSPSAPEHLAALAGLYLVGRKLEAVYVKTLAELASIDDLCALHGLRYRVEAFPDKRKYVVRLLAEDEQAALMHRYPALGE